MCPAKAVRNCYKVKKIENLLLSTDKNWLLLATLPLLDPWLHSPSSADHFFPYRHPTDHFTLQQKTLSFIFPISTALWLNGVFYLVALWALGLPAVLAGQP